MLRISRILGGVLLLLTVTLILVNLQPASAAALTLTLITQVDAGSGTVSPACPAPTGCNEAANIGTTVSITATPNSGFQFSSWSTQTGASCLGGPTVNPCQVQIPVGTNFAGTIGATFTPIPPVPEYPIGLPLLAIFMVLAYAVIKRRT